LARERSEQDTIRSKLYKLEIRVLLYVYIYMVRETTLVVRMLNGWSLVPSIV